MRKLYNTKLINRPEMKFYLVLDYMLPSTWPKSTQAEIQNDGGSLGLVISLKSRSRLSHLIKRETLMFSLRQYILDFPIINSKFQFPPTFTSNLFFWTRNKNDIFLKHMISSTLVKCMIISIVMPSYPNVTTKFPKPDNIKHNPKNHVSHLSIHEFAHRALWLGIRTAWLSLFALGCIAVLLTVTRVFQRV